MVVFYQYVCGTVRGNLRWSTHVQLSEHIFFEKISGGTIPPRNHSKRRSERAGIMEKPGAPHFKAWITTDIFCNEEPRWSRSDCPLHANAATPYIMELIPGWWFKKGADCLNWHDRYSAEFWLLRWRCGGFSLSSSVGSVSRSSFRTHNSSPRIIATSSSPCCVWSSGRGRRRGRRGPRRQLWQRLRLKWL